jgi:hypothetical protein
MALADDFARQFPNEGPSAGLSRGRFWREAVEDGSISRTKTGRATEEMKSPGGAVFWVQPGETTNLKAQGWSQLSTGIKPKAPGPSAEETRLATERANEQRRADARAAERRVTGFGGTEAAYRAVPLSAKTYITEEGGTRTVSAADRAAQIAAQESKGIYGPTSQATRDAEAQRMKDEVAAQLRFHIDNAATHPTDAIYAQYLSGTMSESQVRSSLETAIAARLEGMGIPSGEDPTVAGTGFVREGTGFGRPPGWPDEERWKREHPSVDYKPWEPGAISFESGSDLVTRMAQAELERLRNKFRNYIPQPNQGTGESDSEWQARLKTGFHMPEGIKPAPVVIKKDGTVVTTDDIVDDDRTDFEIQQDLNRERRLSEERRIDAEIDPFTGTPGLPGAPIGPEDLGDIIRREREATQEGRNLELLDYLNRTFNFGDLSPIVQRPLSRAVGTGPDLTSQYYTQLFGQGSPTGQVPTQTFASFLQGGLPTAGSLQTNLQNIFGQLGQGGDTNFLRTLQGTFQDPKDVFGAALQPGLKRVAPAVRGAFESQAGQQFQNVLAADPMRFKTPQESFRFFGNKGYF